ncbi:ATPase AAA domain-containing protein 2B [Actinomortierella ambigua]|nr:ATPase AAA domain-containing protein 2B [Actinomortierella ambigua]
MDDDSPLSELTTASDLTSGSTNLKRSISSDRDLLMDDSNSQVERSGTLLLEHQLSDQEANDAKRRRIHEGSQDSTSLPSTLNHEAAQDTFHELSHETSQALENDALSLSRKQRQTQQIRTTSRSFELRRSVKRVNYAEPGASDDLEEEEYYTSNSRRSRTRSKQPSAYDSELEDEEDDDEDHSEQGVYQTGDSRADSRNTQAEGSTLASQTSTGRTLRDRSTISAPKPFPTESHTSRSRPRSSQQHPPRSSQGGSLRRSGIRDRYEDSEDLHRSGSRQHSSRFVSQAPRPIVEGMRITRAMLSSLASEPSLSREATPDQPIKGKGRVGDGFGHELSYDEDDEMEGQEQDSHRGDEDDDEDMNGSFKSRLDSPSIQGQDGVRMTRLRARALLDPSKQQHGSSSPSRRKSRPSHSHSQRERESNKKYDLRERPKNRPTYIADRPLPTPTRQRTVRHNMYGGRDSRSGRPSLLDSFLRAGEGSSSDEMGPSNYRKRSGGGESRSSSSRFLPMNLGELGDSRLNAIATRPGHLADTDPLAISKTVDFDHVGGLDHHIKDLKEMVILPLLYPEAYKHFQITPPRGVLFHGPPGTGKTLLARALATSCSTETQKVAFFMRKGADVLSKWVGEAERQLRLLFEEAKAWQPSIIFFDEIDGLCPVRSSKQEQIHASIVSTMLALMDGLDSRVIGATNRIDAIDPALRRPGRFDREFYFPLPDEMARRKIIDINTRGWEPSLDERFKDELARMTTRYCGADIKALCTEAALKAIRRRYPQIYDSTEKLQIDVSKITVEEVDLLKSANALVPAASRITGATASPIPSTLLPLLGSQFSALCDVVDTLFPRKVKRSGASSSQRTSSNDVDDDFSFQALGYRSLQRLRTFRPRILVAGTKGMGQRYIGPALLHHLEGCTVQPFDLAALMSESSRTPEAACVQYFIEVKRHVPSVIYIPHIDTWWNIASSAVRATFANLLDDLNPEDSVLFLATTETPLEELPLACQRLFMTNADSAFTLMHPDTRSREEFFRPLLQDIVRSPKDFAPPPKSLQVPEQLKKAPPPQPRVPTAEEKKLLREHDAYVFRELRISLRTIVDELFKERKFKPFFRPVEPEESVDYYEIVKKPMDLTTINDKVDNHVYLTVKEFLVDIDQIVENASLYNDINDPSRIVYRARAFQDVVHAMIGRLDPELITETEKSATRWRQENKANLKVQGERMSRRRQGLEPTLVLDDPEALLRHRSQIARQASASSGLAEKDVDGVTEQQQQQQEQQHNAPEAEVEGGDDLENKQEQVADVHQQQHQDGAQVDVQPAVATMEGIQQTADVPMAQAADVAIEAPSSSSQPTADAVDVIVTEIKVEPKSDATADSLLHIMSHSAMEVAVPDLSQPQDHKTPEPENMEDVHHPQEGEEHDAIVANSATVDGDGAPSTTNEDENIREGDAVGEQEDDIERTVEVDDAQLTNVKALLLQSTQGLSVEDLDQLRASLYSVLWKHRLDWDKRDLLHAMEDTIKRLSLHFQRLRSLEEAERQSNAHDLE